MGLGKKRGFEVEGEEGGLGFSWAKKGLALSGGRRRELLGSSEGKEGGV